jgi:alpha-pyrone synthase
MKSYITSIGIANPPYRVSQKQAVEFMSDNIELKMDEHRKLRALYKSSGIEYRYSVLNDFCETRGNYRFFPNEKGAGVFPTVLQRMLVYEQHASDLAAMAVRDCLKDELVSEITHLITVSCTGMFAPGMDIELIDKLGLSSNIQRVAINFMGCYAAFNALKVGDAICRSDTKAKVLIVCLEFCTIHFQKNSSMDHLISNAIFGDGAAAVLLEPKIKNGFGLSLESFYCDIASEGKKDMAWHISDFGFEMTLSSYVPDMIKGGIRKLTENLFLNMEVALQDISYFAIHPGGRKILEVIEEELGLSRHDNRYSYEVLKNYGNMSSPTILFVLHQIFSEIEISRKEGNILSFAFGPGLTLESMMLKAYILEPKRSHHKVTEVNLIQKEG